MDLEAVEKNLLCSREPASATSGSSESTAVDAGQPERHPKASRLLSMLFAAQGGAAAAGSGSVSQTLAAGTATSAAAARGRPAESEEESALSAGRTAQSTLPVVVVTVRYSTEELLTMENLRGPDAHQIMEIVSRTPIVVSTGELLRPPLAMAGAVGHGHGAGGWKTAGADRSSSGRGNKQQARNQSSSSRLLRHLNTKEDAQNHSNARDLQTFGESGSGFDHSLLSEADAPAWFSADDADAGESDLSAFSRATAQVEAERLARQQKREAEQPDTSSVSLADVGRQQDSSTSSEGAAASVTGPTMPSPAAARSGTRSRFTDFFAGGADTGHASSAAADTPAETAPAESLPSTSSAAAATTTIPSTASAGMVSTGHPRRSRALPFTDAAGVPVVQKAPQAVAGEAVSGLPQQTEDAARDAILGALRKGALAAGSGSSATASASSATVGSHEGPSVEELERGFLGAGSFQSPKKTQAFGNPFLHQSQMQAQTPPALQSSASAAESVVGVATADVTQTPAATVAGAVPASSRAATTSAHRNTSAAATTSAAMGPMQSGEPPGRAHSMPRYPYPGPPMMMDQPNFHPQFGLGGPVPMPMGQPMPGMFMGGPVSAGEMVGPMYLPMPSPGGRPMPVFHPPSPGVRMPHTHPHPPFSPGTGGGPPHPFMMGPPPPAGMFPPGAGGAPPPPPHFLPPGVFPFGAPPSNFVPGSFPMHMMPPPRHLPSGLGHPASPPASDRVDPGRSSSHPRHAS